MYKLDSMGEDVSHIDPHFKIPRLAQDSIHFRPVDAKLVFSTHSILHQLCADGREIDTYNGIRRNLSSWGKAQRLFAG